MSAECILKVALDTPLRRLFDYLPGEVPAAVGSRVRVPFGRQQLVGVVMGLAEGYLEPLRRAEVDTLVLGCTHYPLLSGVIQLTMGAAVTLVSSAEETAKDLLRVLTERDELRPHDAPPASRVFEATGDPEAFVALATRFLGPVVTGVQRHVGVRN